MAIFLNTMVKLVKEYRTLLRRQLTQAERMVKLRDLGLGKRIMQYDEVTLYNAGQAIIADLENAETQKKQGYYTYSGMKQFQAYLKNYLSHYCVENDRVVHRAQKASKALLTTIQLTGQSQEQYDANALLEHLLNCNAVIVDFGSPEQYKMQKQIFKNKKEIDPSLYGRAIAHLESLVTNRCSDIL